MTADQPMPAEACTELGADQDVRRPMQALAVGLLIVAACVFAGLLVFGAAA